MQRKFINPQGVTMSQSLFSLPITDPSNFNQNLPTLKKLRNQQFAKSNGLIPFKKTEEQVSFKSGYAETANTLINVNSGSNRLIELKNKSEMGAYVKINRNNTKNQHNSMKDGRKIGNSPVNQMGTSNTQEIIMNFRGKKMAAVEAREYFYEKEIFKPNNYTQQKIKEDDTGFVKQIKSNDRQKEGKRSFRGSTPEQIEYIVQRQTLKSQNAKHHPFKRNLLRAAGKSETSKSNWQSMLTTCNLKDALAHQAESHGQKTKTHGPFFQKVGVIDPFKNFKVNIENTQRMPKSKNTTINSKSVLSHPMSNIIIVMENSMSDKKSTPNPPPQLTKNQFQLGKSTNQIVNPKQLKKLRQFFTKEIEEYDFRQDSQEKSQNVRKVTKSSKSMLEFYRVPNKKTKDRLISTLDSYNKAYEITGMTTESKVLQKDESGGFGKLFTFGQRNPKQNSQELSVSVQSSEKESSEQNVFKVKRTSNSIQNLAISSGSLNLHKTKHKLQNMNIKQSQLANNQRVGRGDISKQLINISSIQNMKKNNESQSSVRRTLNSFQYDDSNTLFDSVKGTNTLASKQPSPFPHPEEKKQEWPGASQDYKDQEEDGPMLLDEGNPSHQRLSSMKTIHFGETRKSKTHEKSSFVVSDEQLQKFMSTGQNSLQIRKTPYGNIKDASEKIEAKPANDIVIRNIQNVKHHKENIHEHNKFQYKQQWLTKSDLPQGLNVEDYGNSKFFTQNYLDPEMVRHYWTKELDTQLRETRMLENSCIRHKYIFEDVQNYEGESSDSENYEEHKMKDSERVNHEKKMRRAIIQRGEKFANQGGPIGAYDIPIQNLHEDKPYIKRHLFITKLENKLDSIVNPIIKSYKWEVQRKELVPTDPGEFMALIGYAYGLQKNQLLEKFLLYLKGKHEALRIKMEQINRFRTQSSILTSKGDTPLRSKTNNFQSLIKRRMTKIEAQFDRDDVLAEVKDKKTIMKEILNQQKMNKIMIERENYLDRYSAFQQQVIDNFFELQDKIQKSARAQKAMFDPEPNDMDNLLSDENIELLMNNSECYEHIQTLSKKKQEIEEVQQGAEELLDSLRSTKFESKLREAGQIERLKNEFMQSVMRTKLHNDQFKQDLMPRIKKEENLTLDTILNTNSKKERMKKVLLGINTSFTSPFITPLASNRSSKKSSMRGSKSAARSESPLAKKRKELDQRIIDKVNKNIRSQPISHVSQCSSDKSSINEDVEFSHYARDAASKVKIKRNKILEDSPGKNSYKSFVKSTLHQNISIPLPLMGKVKEGKLTLVDYYLDSENVKALQRQFKLIMPWKLTKIVLINNSLTDENLAFIFNGLSKSKGLKSLVVQGNTIGPLAHTVLFQNLLTSENIKTVQKLTLVGLQEKKTPIEADRMVKCLEMKASSLFALKKLTLSNLGLDESCTQSLVFIVQDSPILYYLDVSFNHFKRKDLRKFIHEINGTSFLKMLNISYNSCTSTITPRKTKIDFTFEKSLVRYVHSSKSLLHLDISGIGISIKQLTYFLEKGLRKSRMLLSCHMNDLGLNGDYLEKAKKVLKTVDYSSLVQLNKEMARKIETEQPLIQKKGEVSQKKEDKAKKMYENQNILNREDRDNKVVFQRILGHPEMVNSHRWECVTNQQCHICSKACYTIVVWNKKLAYKQSKQIIEDSPFTQVSGQLGSPFQYTTKMFRQPLLAVEDKIYPMLTVKEFIDRQIKFGQSPERNFKQKADIQRFEKVQGLIEDKIKATNKVKLTYWKELQSISNSKQGQDQALLRNWAIKVQKGAAFNTFFPINLSEFQQFLKNLYSRLGIDQDQIVEETYISAVMLNKQEFNSVIQYPKIDGVSFFKSQAPKSHSMSINKLQSEDKKIKKDRQALEFQISQSVFSQGANDTPKDTILALQTDLKKMEMPKSAPDTFDRDQIEAFFLKNFEFLFTQYQSMHLSQAYPLGIEFSDFQDACKDWKIFDDSYSLENLEADFKKLTKATNGLLKRYHMFDLLIIIAKKKFYDTETKPTWYESLNLLLQDHMMVNSLDIQEAQSFRERYMWQMKVDDFFKHNRSSIDKIMGQKMSMQDALHLAQRLNGIQNFQVMSSFILSKPVFINQDQQAQELLYLNQSESYEFLCRLSHLCFIENIGIQKKVEQVLAEIKPDLQFKECPQKEEDKVESESDYDDDFVLDLVLQSMLKAK